VQALKRHRKAVLVKKLLLMQTLAQEQTREGS
jgi:hypothetical protein